MKDRRKDRRQPQEPVTYYEPKKEPKPLRPLNENQHRYIQSVEHNDLTFATGVAGSGKTFIAAAIASQKLSDGEIERIIITRPGIEAGEKYGFIPGELHEKYAPFIEPFRDALEERLGKTQVGYFIKTGKIQAKPLAFMRGTNFHNAFCILDEAQNTTPEQMLMFLTRIGRNCKVIVDGDIRQKDVNGTSGLLDAINRLKNVPSVGIVNFTIDDCVRSGLVKHILRAYNK